MGGAVEFAGEVAGGAVEFAGEVAGGAVELGREFAGVVGEIKDLYHDGRDHRPAMSGEDTPSAAPVAEQTRAVNGSTGTAAPEAQADVKEDEALADSPPSTSRRGSEPGDQ